MTAANDPWQSLAAARLPAAGLAALAAVRHFPDVTVQMDGDTAWVHWPAGRLDVVNCLMPVAGAIFYRPVGDEWFRFNSRLPASECPPETDKLPVSSVIVPERMEPRAPFDADASSIVLTVVRGGPTRPATAMLALMRDLASFAETATSRELSSVQGALDGDRAILLGPSLPSVPNATRYWGESLFVPLGHRVEPELPPELVHVAVGATADDFVFLNESGAEIVPRSAFRSLTRAMLRLALASRSAAL